MTATAKDLLLRGDSMQLASLKDSRRTETDLKFAGLLYGVQRNSQNAVGLASLHVLLRTTNIFFVY